MKKHILKFVVILFLYSSANSQEFKLKTFGRWNPNKGHSHPASAIFVFGSKSPEYLAKFDLIMSKKGDMPQDIGSQERAFLERIRELNPNALWLTIRDWTNAAEEIRGFPDEWYLRDKDGNFIELYGPKSFWSDYTDFCPRVSFQGRTWRLNEYFAWHMAEVSRRMGDDGVGSQGLYYKGHVSWYGFDAIDMDRNGVDDNGEHGKSWIVNQWVSGVDKFVEKLRDELGDDKYIVINTGSGDFVRPDLTNGAYWENTNALWSWEYDMAESKRNHQKSQPPGIFVWNYAIDNDAPGVEKASSIDSPVSSKDYFPHVRFQIGRAAILGEYSDIEASETGEHNHKEYYDEFDIDLGWPTSPALRLKSTGGEGYGVWVRFFDNGSVIFNADKKNNTVTDAEIRGLSGYNGPYWRFLGNQDPNFNNGEKFNSVTLEGNEYPGYRDVLRVVGDAIVLVNRPMTVVSDIIADNNIWMTTPGSSPAQLTGNWEGQCYNNAYQTRCPRRTVKGRGPYWSAAIGTSGKALYASTINIAGKYSIWEWHPDESLSSSVPYKIKHANGTETINVNQSVKSGQWNYLGEWKLDKDSYVEITASGRTAADAILFRYAEDGGGVVIDRFPPSAPKNVQISDK
jgi:hypothetical protein